MKKRSLFLKSPPTILCKVSNTVCLLFLQDSSFKIVGYTQVSSEVSFGHYASGKQFFFSHFFFSDETPIVYLEMPYCFFVG